MRRQGFTLFEVLIALMVVVILIASVSSTVNVAFKSQAVAERAVDSVRETQTVGDIWVADVGCVVPPSALSASYDSMAYQVAWVAATQAAYEADPTGQTVVGTGGINGMDLQSGISVGSGYLFGPFKGDNISMSFYSTGSELKAAVQGDIRYVEYCLAQQADGRMAFVRRADTNLLAPQTNAQLPEEVLVTGVRAIVFQYFDGSGWRDTWESSGTDTNNTLPYAVKMTLTLEPAWKDGPERTLTRFATVWCAAKTVIDATDSVAASQAAADEAAAGGN